VYPSTAVEAPGAPAPPEAITINHLLTLVGRDTVRVVRAPNGFDTPIRGVIAWDPTGPTAEVIEADDLVLLTVSPQPEQMRAVAQRAQAVRAAGLVMRPEDLPPEWADGAGCDLAILTATGDLSWRIVRRELVAALAVGPDPADGIQGQLTDLPSLADAVAVNLGGPVLVTDGRLRVIAHHAPHSDVDDLTRDWIVRRTPPPELRDHLPRQTELPHRWGIDTVTRVTGPRGSDWLVVVIRAGTDVLGSIWANAGAGTDPAARAILTRAARRAAMLLARSRDAAEPEHRMRSDLLHAALSESDSSAGLAAALTLDGNLRPQLLGFRAPGGPAAEQLEDLIALRMEAGSPRATTTRLGDRVYVLTLEPVDPGGNGPLREIVERIRQRGWPDLRCVVSDVLDELTELPHARQEVDRVLDVIVADSGPVVAGVTGFRSRSVLAQVSELSRQQPRLMRGPVLRLAEIDDTEGSSYLATLRAYFDTGHDLRRAAEALYIHRNTLKYRLSRVRELTGLDLTDPLDRLVSELQLRMHDLNQSNRSHHPHHTISNLDLRR
jgi:hypothetical protein